MFPCCAFDNKFPLNHPNPSPAWIIVLRQQQIFSSSFGLAWNSTFENRPNSVGQTQLLNCISISTCSSSLIYICLQGIFHFFYFELLCIWNKGFICFSSSSSSMKCVECASIYLYYQKINLLSYSIAASPLDINWVLFYLMKAVIQKQNWTKLPVKILILNS